MSLRELRLSKPVPRTPSEANEGCQAEARRAKADWCHYPLEQVARMSELAAVPPIAALPTSIALFVGWAPSGPVDQALRVKSVADYDRDFGGLDAGALLGYALRHFFGKPYAS